MGTYSNTTAHDLVQLFADKNARVVPYHCLVSDLNGMDDYEFLQRLQKSFNVRVARDADHACPAAEREYGLYIAGHWYHMTAIAGTWFFADPVKDLDISILRDNMLHPVLGIDDCAQQSDRLAYIDGNQEIPAISALVDEGRYQAAILLFAPSVRRILEIAEQGRVMPALSFAIQVGNHQTVCLS